MSAEKGWIGVPQPQEPWRDSHYSRKADEVTEDPADEEGTGRDGP